MKLFSFLKAGDGRAWKPVVWAAIVAHVVVLGVYGFFFRGHTRSASPEMWAAFGDYMGGVLGPVLGLLTIILLVQTLRQTDDALAQSREALKQSREELKLTRDELRQGQDIQRRTKEALDGQLALASDMNRFQMMVALLDYYRKDVERIEASIEQQMKRSPRHNVILDTLNKQLECARALEETAAEVFESQAGDVITAFNTKL